MTYPEALDYVASLAPRGWRLGLDRMQELARRAGLKLDQKFIHVAGTNGKGSVTAITQALLQTQTQRVGAFFSPYVYDPRERVQLNGEYISRDDFASLTEWLRPIGETLSETEFGGVTEFEFKTALGFRFWEEKQCEWVALEVGLGGRLDSTNIINPTASVIVSIGLDHTSVLGETLAEIASEKAGVIKPGRPVVVGEVPNEAWKVIAAQAQAMGSEIWRFGDQIQLVEDVGGRFAVHTPVASYEGLISPIEGVMQPHNVALSIAALHAAALQPSQEEVETGLAQVHLPGRMERRTIGGKEALLDGAHNRAASEVLAESLRRQFPDTQFCLLTSMVQGHDPYEFYEPLQELVSEAHFVPLDFHRAVPPDALAEAAPYAKKQVHESVEAGLQAALASESPLLITGSFYLLGEIASLNNY